MKSYIIFLLLIGQFLGAQYSISSAERNTLISIHQQTNGDHWISKWDFSVDPKFWHGVKVKNGYVTELQLNANALSGNFPNSVLQLSHLEKLDLSNNFLSGNLPHINNLPLTYLNISNNQLQGNLANLINIASLETLFAGNNQFTISDFGFLSNMSHLQSLDFSSCNITSVPAISTLTQLKHLNISNNPIVNFSDLSHKTSLEELFLSGVSITKVPSEITSLSQLKVLDISNNAITNFSGLSSLNQLEWLSLEKNNLLNIPSELSSLSNLIHLNLNKNQLSQNFSIIQSLSKLQLLHLDYNMISGSFPTEILSDHLQFLSLSSNQLSGEIPSNTPEVCNISNNRFSLTDIENFLNNKPKNMDFFYSPQRYDETKTVKAALGSSANLNQILSSSEGFAFTWLKNLDQDIFVNSENYLINSVENKHYDVYSCEAYLVKNNTLYVLDFANFREPIILENTSTLGTENPTEKYLAIYPNPTSDYIYIKNTNHFIHNISIFDATGKIIYTGKENRILVQNLPTGSYILRIKTDEGHQAFKFIKK